MKRRLVHTLLLITLLAFLTLGTPPLGQPAVVYAAPDTVTIRPSGAGDETLLTIGGSTPVATNWESVDETSSDDDITFVYETNSQAFTTDLYNMGDTALSGTINSVTVYIHSRSLVTPTQTSAYTRIKTNGFAYNGAEITLTTTYTTYSTAYATNPQTTAAWTWTEVNALQAGVGLRQPATTGGNRDSQCTMVWVVVDYTPAAISITNAPNTYGFGSLAASSTTSTGLAYFTVINDGTTTVNISIQGDNLTGSSFPWALSDDATNGVDTYGLKAGISSYNVIVKSTGFSLLISGLAASVNETWGLELLAPSSYSGSDGPTSGNVTLSVTVP